jgi:hypothetical protein
MAFRMRHWIGVTVASMALIAVWRLPLDSFPTRGADLRPAEHRRHEALAKEFRETGEILRRVLWSDSLSALTVREARDGVMITSGRVTATDAQRTELTDQLERLVRSEIAQLPARADVVFGYALQRSDHGRLPDMAGAGRARTETYAGSVDATYYCMQVRVTSRVQTDLVALLRGDDAHGVRFRSGTLGPCRFYLAYGLPGPDVGRWMEDGGVGYAMSSGAGDVTNGDFPTTDDGDWLRTQRLSRSSIFGYNMLARVNRPIEADRCLTGDAGACAYLFENPAAADPILARQLDVVRRSPAISIGTVSTYFSFAPDEEFLLSDLEAEFGAEAFARFWTSNDGLGDAFERAFGIDAGSWTLGWIARSREIEPPGPGLPRSARSGATLAVVLLLGIAYLRSRERSVG